MPCRIVVWVAVCALAAAVPAQSTILDVVDGETLYQGGSLVSLSSELEREDTLRSGGRRVADPSASQHWRLTSTLAWQYGLRNDLQIGAALPHVVDEARGAAGETAVSGIGDLELLAKWRFHRWDAPRVSINTSLIAAVTLPTGDDDRVENGIELEPERQPGSGSVDPAIGAAITPEPGRWRFNAAILHQLRTDLDGDGDRPGSAWFGELAVGNRFWLEPYPGPFMRLDVFVHWYDEARDRADHRSIADSGGERIAVGATWAFRPRPSLDLQLSAELPVWQDVNGTQLDDDWSVQFAFGHRF